MSYIVICLSLSSCDNQPCQRTKITSVCLTITHTTVMLIFTTKAEFNGESFKAYRMQIPFLELKIRISIHIVSLV